MRDVLKTEELDIPEGITVTIKSRLISVTGPRGTLTKNVRHVDMDIRLLKGKTTNKVTLAVWQGGRKHVACLRTIRSLIMNMITGVTKVRGVNTCHVDCQLKLIDLQGFLYKMRAVYAHFPINCIIQDDGRAVEIRNFLGEKVSQTLTIWDFEYLSRFRIDCTTREDAGRCDNYRVESPERRASPHRQRH
jgi:large subunit ribosomal protein L9e